MITAVSLEDLRRNRYQTVAEFAAAVGVTTSTYYRALKGRVEIPTMRQIAARLNLTPAAIVEFTPAPSNALLAQITEAIDRAERDGWIEVDPETLRPTGRRVREVIPPDAA